MKKLQIDDLDIKLIEYLQVSFPLKPEPFSSIGESLGINMDEVIKRIQQLKCRGIVRSIGPVIETRRVGYQTTLVAMKVTPERLKQTEKIILNHPAISHAYRREHRLNLWLTFAAPAESDMDCEIRELAAEIGSSATFSFPAIKVFKIGAHFDMGVKGNSSMEMPALKVNSISSSLPSNIKLSIEEKQVLNSLQKDLPIIYSPFNSMADDAGLKLEAFLDICSSLLSRGILRRYSASVNQRKIGYQANALICWKVPVPDVERTGKELAKIQQVSHCYERKAYPSWPYNIYTMLHSRSRKNCRDLTEDMARSIGIQDYLALFSTHEIKKTRIRYIL